MTSKTHRIDYSALAAQLTSPMSDLQSAGQARSGSAASKIGYEFLLREYGSDAAIQAELQRGRPKVDSLKQGASPTVRGRINEHEFAAFEELRQNTGRTQSDLVREAVHLLLLEHS